MNRLSLIPALALAAVAVTAQAQQPTTTERSTTTTQQRSEMQRGAPNVDVDVRRTNPQTDRSGVPGVEANARTTRSGVDTRTSGAGADTAAARDMRADRN